MLCSVQLVILILVVTDGSFLLVVATLQRFRTGTGRTHFSGFIPRKLSNWTYVYLNLLCILLLKSQNVGVHYGDQRMFYSTSSMTNKRSTVLPLLIHLTITITTIKQTVIYGYAHLHRVTNTETDTGSNPRFKIYAHVISLTLLKAPATASAPLPKIMALLGCFSLSLPVVAAIVWIVSNRFIEIAFLSANINKLHK